MVHVSTVCIVDGYYYVTYYANTISSVENPTQHTSRLVYCPTNDITNKTYIDLGNIGDTIDGKIVTEIYDTVLLRKDDVTLYLAWTVKMDDVYYRVYRTFDVSTKTLSNDTLINTFTVGDTTVGFNASEMTSVFESYNVAHKPIDYDIGIMQKLTARVENEITYYYTGVYSNRFNCIVKSHDLINWVYVSQPTFENYSQHENAVYVKGDIAYYFCRQFDTQRSGFLATYNIANNVWSRPVYVYDTQSRSDFFEYDGYLYLIHAPKDRNHLSIMCINTTNISKSYTIQTAQVPNYFYPFILVYDNEIYVSFTQARLHIYLSKFTLGTISASAISTAFKSLLGIS